MKTSPLLKTLLLAGSAFLATLNADAQYCQPNFTYGCSGGDDINAFAISGANGTFISDTGTPCSASAYENRTNESVSMAQGSSYTAAISSDYSSDENVQVFIDFNNDQAFSPSESVGGFNMFGSAGTTFPVSIPAGATTGSHRMRVVVSYDISYPYIDPCPDSLNYYDYGEVHDYTALIVAGTGISCAAPLSISASGMTTSSASLNWTAVTGAAGYEYAVDQSATAPAAAGIFTTATSATASGLLANTFYHLHVRARCSASTYSPWVDLGFATPYTNGCNAPDGLTVSNLSNTAVTLSWNPSPGTAGYEVFLSTTYLLPLNGTPIAGNGATYSNLTPNSTYYGWVRQQCGTSASSNWAVIWITTGNAPAPASSISGFIYKDSVASPGVDTYKVWLINYNSASNSLTALDSVQTTSHYSFSNMANGSYFVKAAPLNGIIGTTGQIPTYHDSSLYWSAATPVVVSSNAAVTANIWMRQGLVATGPGFIGGNVSLGANKGTGNGVPRMLIYLRNAATRVIRSAYTDANGDFSFSSIPAGTYSVYPEAINFATTAYVNIVISGTQTNRSGINFNQDAAKKNIKPRTTGIGTAVAGVPSITLAPNPARGAVLLQWKGINGQELQVIITSITGQIAYSGRIDATGKTAARIDISGLREGVYFVRLNGCQGDAVQKLVVLQ